MTSREFEEASRRRMGIPLSKDETRSELDAARRANVSAAHAYAIHPSDENWKTLLATRLRRATLRDEAARLGIVTLDD